MSRGSLFWELRLERIWRSLLKEEFSKGMGFFCQVLHCRLVFGSSCMDICIPGSNEWNCCRNNLDSAVHSHVPQLLLSLQSFLMLEQYDSSTVPIMELQRTISLLRSNICLIHFWKPSRRYFPTLYSI